MRILILLASLLIPIQTYGWGVVEWQEVVEEGGSYFYSGAVESFESSEGAFDTLGWTETDVDGVISTYDSTYSECGSSGLKVISAVATEATSRIVADLNAQDNDFYFRIYLGTSLSTLNTYSISDAIYFSENSDGSNIAVGIRLHRNTGDPYIRMYAASTTEYVNMTASRNHMLEMHVVGNGGGSTIRVWEDISGTWTLLATSGADTEIEGTSYAYSPQYLVIEDTTDNGTSTFYYDAAQVDMDGVGHIGEVTCP